MEQFLTNLIPAKYLEYITFEYENINLFEENNNFLMEYSKKIEFARPGSRKKGGGFVNHIKC